MARRDTKTSPAFTLIELMVVIFIVAILAAVAIPIYRGKISAAKWAEGKAMAGTIAVALRSYAADHPFDEDTPGYANPDLTELGFKATDLQGSYFGAGNYSWTSSNPQVGPFSCSVTVTKGTGITEPDRYRLTDGTWSAP